MSQEPEEKVKIKTEDASNGASVGRSTQRI